MVKVGSTLSATPASVTGDPTPVRSWQWLRDNVTISGATAADYYVQAADEGAKLSVRQIETNFVGVATATSAQTATVGAYDPGTLFESGEVGAWYDPSDLTTVFQDAAGTTPAGVGDPVGLILDKSQGLVLGPELVTNGTFDDATGWTLSGGWAIDGGTLQWSSAYGRAGFTVGAAAFKQGVSYKVSGTIVSRTTGTVVAYLALPGNPKAATVQLPSGTGDFTLILSPNADVSQFGFESLSPSGLIEIDNVSVKELPGNHATQTTSAARPVLQSSGGLYYLDFDGVDDWLVTPTITPGIDKVQVFIGVRKLSDASVNMITELGNNQINAFSIGNYNSVGGTGPYYNFWSRGSIKASGFAWSGTYSAPITNIITGLGDISGDSSTLRVDGTQIAQVNEDQGTGNYLAYPLYIGTRGPGSLLFNGHIYSMVVRFGDNLIAQKITDAETYLAAKSGVTL